MQPASESQQPHASAEERLGEQARETQQLREQLARASVKEGPTLPPLSVPELNNETSGCPTLWGCSMVCIGKNIANCSKNPQFLPVMCALCPRCAHAPNVCHKMIVQHNDGPALSRVGVPQITRPFSLSNVFMEHPRLRRSPSLKVQVSFGPLPFRSVQSLNLFADLICPGHSPSMSSSCRLLGRPMLHQTSKVHALDANLEPLSRDPLSSALFPPPVHIFVAGSDAAPTVVSGPERAFSPSPTMSMQRRSCGDDDILHLTHRSASPLPAPFGIGLRFDFAVCSSTPGG